MSRNQYKYRARPTVVDGVTYASRLEARCALLLIKHGVPFTPHVKYDCFDREGRPFSYTVDFKLHYPTKFLGIGFAVEALETKGILRKHDLLRNDALKFCHGVRCYIVLEPLLNMWWSDGID